MDEWWWDMHWDVIRCVCEALYEAVATRRQFGFIRAMPAGWKGEEGSGVFCVTPVADCETGLYAIGVKFYAVRVPRVETAPCPEAHPPDEEAAEPE